MTNLSAEPWFNDPAVRRVLELLNRDGGEGRIVGGAVRNSLMGLPVSDIDIATTLVPEEVVRRAKEDGVKAVPTGIDHGTVTLVVDGRGFEVTTLRHDVETDGRRAQVAFGAGWAEDAMRRDLTINALYLDADGEVIDLVDGLDDIEAKRVRFIGDANLRIAEDYLRVLRFFRFFAWYGDGRPDADGLKACAAARRHLRQLSAERIWAEMKKLLSAPDPGRALLWMRQTAILTEILPETERWGIDAIPGLIAAEKALGWTPDPLLRLASIVPRDVDRLKAMAARLRMSNAETAFLEQFAGAPAVADDLKEAALDRLLYRAGKTGIIARLKLDLASARANSDGGMAGMEKVGRVSTLLSRAERFEKPSFPVSGADVLAAGIAPGPTVGDLLKRLEDEWLERNFTLDRARLLARLEELKAGG
ncbi:CCA tRNA nucleotidyltransferase [Ciceribacter sp. L1K22]|uniref:CCA tRNA nucleotidyltransferase n=1 Tax=Ciceribacter sp. L1K22 TaxID=2820275 RepID=UPI001ABDD358|nr:CCA tRNA nucleotidyltransferase [Ciceribacter sp. L1K22]MBO3761038.1 CCA tRNA nucleotidyltransferase [Ciceribacter sp. L1K22]